MIPRREYIKRTPLKRKPRKPRKEGMDDPEYLAWLRTWPCWICLRKHLAAEGFPFFRAIDLRYRRDMAVAGVANICGPTEAAHVGVRGLGRRCSDREAMPLGHNHHQHSPESHHVLGKNFWKHHGLDRDTVLAILHDIYAKETGK